MQISRPIPITRDLVLLGGGHTHALVLRKWAMSPLAGVQVTLVNPGVKAPYTGMLPGFVAGHYSRNALDIDLVKLARAAGARLILDRATSIDTRNKRVQLGDRPDIAYDTLSVDIGVTSALAADQPQVPGLVPAKPLGPFADAWDNLLARIDQQDAPPKIAVIGAGVAGVELALAMAFRLRTKGLVSATIKLIEAGSVPLRELNRSARAKLLSDLDRTGIEIETNRSVQSLNAGFDFIVSTAGAKPYIWLSETDLTLEKGYVAVNQHLQSLNTPDVFAAGDCAHLSHAPRPKAGVFAVRQAPILFENLRAQLSGNPLRPYNPQRSYLKLISRGGKSAVTDKWGIGLAGDWVWHWKDRIDQKFMKQFQDPVEMLQPPRPEHLALGVASLLDQTENSCGACGAKVAQAPLLQGLAAATPEAVPLDDAAIVKTGDRTEVFSTDHLRAFNADAYTLAKVAAIHALGDIWAMGGRPRTVLSQIILPPLAPLQQREMIREIAAGAGEVFEAAGTRIAGGHTSSGQELTIGFSISGALDGEAITQAGASAGDVLVLTKPIGTGVILAAEMRQRADGHNYQAALDSMCRLQIAASEILARTASAMTDVTGFGLAGHLLNILDGSGLSAQVILADIPVLPGAEQLNAAGIRSTLWQANAEQGSRISQPASGRADLLFDPQTCGGMLAAIPVEKVQQVIDAFAAADESIWQIGTLAEGSPHIELF